MDEKELKQLAIDVVEKKVFGTFNMSESDLNSLAVVFMPFVALKQTQIKQMSDDDIIHVYEYYDKAGPMSINGMPCFSSMHRINQEDWAKVVRYIKEYEVKVKSFLNKKDKNEHVGPTLFDGEQHVT